MRFIKNISGFISYWTIIFLLSGFSLFFTLNILSFKKGIQNINNLPEISLKSGDRIFFKIAVDGDEIAVADENDNHFIVRLLGIKSFESNLKDKDLNSLTGMAFNYLKKLGNSDLKIYFNKYKIDDKGRVLAYIYDGELDIGKLLIKHGYSIVYTQYIFDKISEYLAVENQAKNIKTGLWSNIILSNKIKKLKITWMQNQKK